MEDHGEKKNSVTYFTDDFMDIVQDELINNNRLFILGDFNIHVDDEDNVDAQSFVDCTNSIGFDQHVHDFTRNKLHALDLIFSKSREVSKIIWKWRNWKWKGTILGW